MKISFQMQKISNIISNTLTQNKYLLIFNGPKLHYVHTK